MSDKKYCLPVMEAQMKDFLAQLRVKKGEPKTHTSMDPSGKYYIGTEDIEKFYTIMCNAVTKGVVPTVTECPDKYGPLRFDFDLKASLDVGLKRQYTEDMIKMIVKIIQDEIRQSVPEEIFEEKMLWCIVLEKKSPRSEEGKVKDGFHFHFPHFPCEGWFQDEYLRERVTTRMISDKIWEGTDFLEPVDKFIDKIATKTWLMYGSSKKIGAEPFLYTHAYNDDQEEIPLQMIFEEELVGRKARPVYYLPRLMSIHGCQHIVDLKPEIEKRREIYKPRRKKVQVNVHRKRTNEEVLTDIKTIKDGEIMDMLSDDRAEDFNQWIDVGWTLFNIGQGCQEALDLWIEFSQRSPKFIPGECEDRWGSMEMRGKTIASVLAMARSDNPDRYKEWKDTQVKTWLYRSLTEDKPNEWDVSQVIYRLYKDKFLCADARKDNWYEFKNHRWQKMDDGVTIKKLLATDVVDMYYKLKAEIAHSQTTASEGDRGKLEKQEKKCREIITGLKSCAFQACLMRMCKVQFHDPLFLEKIDENRMLFGCENGVIDLELGIFRDGRPDDYVTFSCGLNYHKYNHEDDEVLELKEFLRKVFPNENRQEYFLDISCSCLEGGNVNKTFSIGTGSGHNAKTATYGLLEKVFGNYCIKFPRELFIVGKGDTSGSARPELVRSRGRRLAIVSEISKVETLNIGILKELTGNDSIFARGLFSEGGEIKPMFTLMMQCNEPPKVPGHDEATWNRIRVLDFESKFVLSKDLKEWPVPSSEKEQFKLKRFHADPTYARKIPEMAPVLLWLLFDRFKGYKQRGLREPEEVKLASNRYREMNDVFRQFVTDRLEGARVNKNADVDGETSIVAYDNGLFADDEIIEENIDVKKTEIPFLSAVDLHAEFKSWYSETYGVTSKFNRIVLVHEFSKLLGSIETKGRIKGWMGFKIVEEESNDKMDALQALHKAK